jgi:lysozyme
MVPPNNASPAALRFVMSCEGFRRSAYNDVLGNCTIGYGHLLHLGNCVAQDFSLHVNRSAAQSLFMGDAQGAINALNNTLSIPVSQQQFDALFSLTFNMGIGRLQTHDVWKDVQSGNSGRVPADIRSLSAGGQGMQYRHANETNIYGNGTYANYCYAH